MMKNEIVVACDACGEERRGAYKALVGKPEGMRLPGRPKWRW
jgi:RNase P subunit RPR2